MSDEVATFIEALRSTKASREGPYTYTDRYRDFKQVFGTDAGKRVLSQIIDLCEGRPATETDAESHARLAYRAGARSVGLKIAAWATVPPPEQ